MAQVAAALKKIVDASNALADERDAEKVDSLPSPREGSAPSEFENVRDDKPAEALSEDTLATLQKDLDELDVDSFLDKL